MKIAIGRPFNAYGARESFEAGKAHIMPALIQKVLRGDDPIVVWGSGKQTRIFVHGKDSALALKLITGCYAVADPVNVGHDRETTIRELIERILKVTSRKPEVVFDTSKPEGAKRKSADLTKHREVNEGFTPQITLDEGLAEIISYFKDKFL